MRPKTVLEQLANQYTLPGGAFYMDEQGTIQTVENIADLKKYLMIKGATQVIFVKSIDRFVESDSSGVADEVTSWASTHPKRKGYRWVLQAVATAASSVAPYMDFNKEGGGTVRLTFGSEGQPIYTILSCLMLLFSSITGYAQSARTSPLIDRTTHVLAWPSDLWTTNAAAIAAALPAGSIKDKAIFGRELLSEFRSRIASLAPSSRTDRKELASVALIGDSWTARSGYANILALHLQRNYGSAGPGWVPMASVINGQATSPTADGSCTADLSLWISDTSASYRGNASPDLSALVSSTVGDRAVIKLTRGPAATSVSLHYLGQTGGGSFRYKWGDGTWTTVDTSAATGYTVLALSNVPTTTIWDLIIEVQSASSNGVTIYGADIRTASTGVVVHKLGNSGASTTHWVAPDGTAWANSITNLTPSLVVVEVGTNEQSLTTEQFAANLNELITRIKSAAPSAGIVLVCVPENETPTPTAMPLLASAMRSVAISQNCAFLDLQPYFGSSFADYAFGSAKAYFLSDGHHPSDDGAALNASAILDVIGLTGNDSAGGMLVVGELGQSTVGYLQSELLLNPLMESNTNWTLGTGWSFGTNNLIHAAGNTAAASQNISVNINGSYQIGIVISNRTAGSVTVAIDSATVPTITASAVTSVVAPANGTVAFTITPTTDFDGTIESVGVRQIVLGQAPLAISRTTEIRGSPDVAGTFVGQAAGGFDTTGYANSGFGTGALAKNTVGYNNSAFGAYSLAYNSRGLNNSAFGTSALSANTTGSRNTALGVSSMVANLTGINNVAVGYFSLYGNTTGGNLVAIGDSAGRYQANGSTALTAAQTSVYIGASARGYSNSDANSVVIAGLYGTGEGANTTVIGTTNTVYTRLHGVSRIVLPSATNGLSSGMLWNNSGTIAVMP